MKHRNRNTFLEEVVAIALSRSLQQDDQDDTTTTSSSSAGVDNNNNDDDGTYTELQEIALTWTSRIAAIISFGSGIYIFRMAWKRRDHVYHRLMLALSIHLLIWSPWMIYGAAAVPVGTPDTWGAFGTTETCTAQGFFIQLSMAVPLYYAFLSCYSWIVVVYGNFDPNKYQWIEKYIHIVANLWPIGSALYLLYIQAFNSTGLRCWIASIPLGCGDGSDILCERGPENISKTLLICGLIPSLLIVLLPTFAMTALVIFIHRRQKLGIVPPCTITAWTIAKQSMVYIGVLYWIYAPTFIHNGMLVFANKKMFVFSLMTCLMTMSMGLWYALVYRYFSLSGATVDESTHADIIERLSSASKNFTKQDSKMTAKTSPMISTGASVGASVGVGAGEDTSAAHVRQRHSSGEFSFNIFDGTAPVNSQYSEFVFEGDDDDEENDKRSTKYWAEIQNQ